MVEIRKLSVGYEKPLLNNISFSVRTGEVIGILGRNGSGKTTLLRGIAGNIRRFCGQIKVAGKDFAAMSLRQRATYLSVLPQQTEVIEGILARDLIEMGRYPHERLFKNDRENAEKAEKSAVILGISGLLDSDCSRLSQGQRQLVFLARCLAQDTPVLLLDEPDSALDFDNTHAMFAAVRALAEKQNKTVMMVLHNPELALQYCDRLLILTDGGIACDFAPAESGSDAVQAALRQLYPHVVVRNDPFDGHFRCYI